MSEEVSIPIAKIGRTDFAVHILAYVDIFKSTFEKKKFLKVEF